MKRPVALTALAVGLVAAGCGADTEEAIPLAPPPPVEDAVADDANEAERPTPEPPPTTVAPVKEEPPASTILPPPGTTPPDYRPVSRGVMESIANDASDRRTVTIDRDAAGNARFWVTAWSGTTADGIAVYCIGSSNYGRSCTPDGHGLAGPAQVTGFSFDHPAVVQLIAESDVVALSATFDDDEPVDLPLTDLGVPSGMQVAAVTLIETRPELIEFRAVVPGEDDHVFEVKVPPARTDDQRKAELGLDTDDDVIFMTEDPLAAAYAPVELAGG